MGRKLRVILDSSVYGWIVEHSHEADFSELAGKTGKAAFYGCSIVRNELKSTPKGLMHGRRRLRMLLLNFYDSLIKRHEIDVAEVAEDLAKYYLLEYNGGVSREKIRNDFLIVAAAAIARLDIVVSEDSRTLLSHAARAAYAKVNARNSLRTPMLYRFKEFEGLLKE